MMQHPGISPAYALTATLYCLIIVHDTRADLFQASTGLDGTWNVYETMSTPLTWADAQNVAQSQSLSNSGLTMQGNLVSIGSAAENTLVEYLSFLSGDRSGAWIGLTDREGAAPLNPTGDAPQESATLPDPAQDGWAWVSGESVGWVNWEPQAPRVPTRADVAKIRLDGRWQDEGSGFGVDQPIAPTLQPGTSPQEAAQRNEYVVEYSFNSPTQLNGIPTIAVPQRVPSQLPGVAGGDNTLGVTNYRLDSVPLSILHVSSTLEAIASGSVVPVEQADGQFAKSNLANRAFPDDPVTPEIHPLATPVPFNSKLISIAKGTVFVEEAGLYTLQVDSDSSFALRVRGGEFQEVRGRGTRDVLDRSVMYYSSRAANSTTRGTIELSAGHHALEFIATSGASPHFWKIASAQGDHLNNVSVQWLPLGSSTILAPQDVSPAVRLSGAATVVNLPDANGGRVKSLEEARNALSDAAPEDTVARDDVTTLVMRDTSGVCCSRPGASLNEEHQFIWPVDRFEAPDGPSTDRDFFSAMIAGTLTVDDGDDDPNEWLDVTFSLFIEERDAADLWIDGASFLAGGTAVDVTESISGDAIMRLNPELSPNDALLGLIQLQEGVEYPFESAFFDSENDAGLEVFAALGNRLDGFDANRFFPVSTSFMAVTEGNRGLAFRALPGDLNHDALLDLEDLDQLSAAIGTADAASDLNSDGAVDNLDTHFWVKDLKKTWIGDANLDGEFNSADLVTTLTAGRFETNEEATWQEGDWNSDGRFTTTDLVVALSDGGYEQGPRNAVSAVPEITSSPVLVIALVTVAGRRRHSVRRLTETNVR